MKVKRNLLLKVIPMILALSVMLIGNVVAADKIFKLGISAPLTGPVAKSGAEQKASVLMALEKIGYKIGDYKIEPVFIDDQADAAKSVNAYSEAIERQGVQAIILAWNTSVSTAVQDILAKYKVPYFYALGAGQTTNQKWLSLSPENRYLIMKGWPVQAKLSVVYAEFLNDAIKKGLWKPKKKVLALGAEDTDWGRGVAGKFKELMVKEGWEIATEEYFALTQTDFYPFLNKCKNKGTTVLFACTTAPASAAALVKQKGEIKLEALYIADGLGWLGDWYKMTGSASDGAFDMQPAISTPAQKQWATKFKSKFGYAPSPSCAGLSFDGINFFIKIAKRTIEKYKVLDSAELFKVGRDEIWTGKLSFSAKDGALFQKRFSYNKESLPDPVVGQSDFYFPIVQYNKGESAVVFPDSMKEANAVFK